MSGGAFNYEEFKIQHIAEQVDFEIQNNDLPDPHYGQANGYSKETLYYMQYTRDTLLHSHKMTKHLDYLLSGDTGEASYLERVKNELQVRKVNKWYCFNSY